MNQDDLDYDEDDYDDYLAYTAAMTETGITEYVRPAGEYTSPPNLLWINGSEISEIITGRTNEEFFDSLPLGVMFAVELVPEPGNPLDRTSIAVDIDGLRIGYLLSWVSAGLYDEVAAANQEGYRVLAQGKIFEWSDKRGILPVKENGKSKRKGVKRHDVVRRFMEVRVTRSGNVAAWLNLPAESRGNDFFDVEWSKADRQFKFQAAMSNVLGDRSMIVCSCELLLGTTEDGLGVEAHIDEVHVGTLRPSSRNEHQDLIKYVRTGGRNGYARLERWPDNIELLLMIPELQTLCDQRAPLWADAQQAKDLAQETEREERARRAEAADLYKGKRPDEWMPVIERLYRSGKLTEALDLLIPVTKAHFESNAITDGPVTSEFTKKSAIICRKLKDYEKEVEVLEYLLAQDKDFTPGWAITRLARASELRDFGAQQIPAFVERESLD